MFGDVVSGSQRAAAGSFWPIVAVTSAALVATGTS
jgi:hypothetical protein